ncbi:hypothetical protein CDD82_5214 [Ophiocordyceps australis]|uniref:Uncharacterized protein n=1 Tax=Ophiocordyceps australis TaxID=1399860 RepID=A0A2C5ZTB5_9HYPO|nr:hypothetical protein CDD82_5214 [Ophiocordyceps australis]
MCTGANKTGTCSYDVYDLDQCHNLDEPFYRNIRTFAPDDDNFACYPRLVDCSGLCTSPTGCTCGAVNASYVHRLDLAAIKWDTLFRSFNCFVPSQQRA